MHLIGRIVPRRIGREVVRPSWQPRRVGGEVEQGDLVAVPLGRVDPGRQIEVQGIVELDVAALDHVGQQQAGEGLDDRLHEQRPVGADRRGVLGGIGDPFRDDHSPVRSDHAHDQTNGLAGGDLRLKDLADLLGARGLAGGERGDLERRRRRVRRRKAEDQGLDDLVVGEGAPEFMAAGLKLAIEPHAGGRDREGDPGPVAAEVLDRHTLDAQVRDVERDADLVARRPDVHDHALGRKERQRSGPVPGERRGRQRRRLGRRHGNGGCKQRGEGARQGPGHLSLLGSTTPPRGRLSRPRKHVRLRS